MKFLILDCTAVCDPKARPTVCLNGKIVFNNICMLKQVHLSKITFFVQKARPFYYKTDFKKA